MKTYITYLITVMALATTSALAHPGLPGHKHPENSGNEQWPFPDFEWSLAIVVLAVIAITAYKCRKKV